MRMVHHVPLLHFEITKSPLAIMTENQFLNICATCRSILKAKDSTIQRVAIPWMHPIREHPIALQRYAELVLKPNRIQAAKKWLRDFIIYSGIWIRQLYRAITRGNDYWKSNDALPDKVDCLFISHVVNRSHLKNMDDFYLSSIPDELVKRNYQVLIGYINNLGAFNKSIKKNIAKSFFPKLYFTDSLSLKQELIIRKSLKKESKLLKRNALKENNSLSQQILFKAAHEILSGEAQSTMRIFDQVKKLVETVRPKSIIVPYEGHAYERICFAAARAVKPDIICISYQHTGVFRLSNAIRQTLATQYNPDIILTPGIETKNDLKNNPEFAGIRIEVLGSVRSIIDSGKTIMHKQRAQLACLVMPEGILSECMQLFKFSIECAYLRPDINFIWRLHPSVSFDEITSQSKVFQNIPPNIIFSTATIESDIEHSTWVLYRGTTAILKAISAGLRPFYLQNSGELTIDPLYKLDKWRINVTKPEELDSWLQHDIATAFKDFPENLPIAQELCLQRFSKLDINVLDTILKERTSN